jgi:uncharacterized membrane protein YhaH (DUF805 family)
MSFDVNSFHHTLDKQKYEIVSIIFGVMAGKCPFCGQQLLVNTKSCSYCGAELTNTPTFSPSSAPTPQSISIDMQNATQGGQPMQQMQAVTTQMGIPQAIPGQQIPNMFGQIGGQLPYTKKEMMSLGEAIKTCFKKYATTKGRAQRSEYWWWTLFSSLVGAGLFITLGAVLASESSGSSEDLESVFMVYLFAGLAYIVVFAIPSLAVLGRRLHDIGWSAWWILLIFVPFSIGSLILFVACLMPSQELANQYDV